MHSHLLLGTKQCLYILLYMFVWNSIIHVGSFLVCVHVGMLCLCICCAPYFVLSLSICALKAQDQLFGKVVLILSKTYPALTHNQ